jgi:dihydrofolate synthase/folylpolyglutamate synthase
MTYEGAIQFLYRLQMFGAKLGLENPLRLAALGGHPEQALRFIHVAGTNGKGSTCAMLESIYRAAGLRVGLFTSPHLVSFAERIQVVRRPIPEADVARWVAAMQPWLAQFPVHHHPTFFEVVTVLALLYFAEQQCDLVIWETGLGGRLDATNIVTPLASVITSIDFDHQQWLGDTLEDIAAEKAGIIKPGVPVITGAAAGRGLEVIVAAARRAGAPLTRVTDLSEVQPPQAGSWEIGLVGEHQRFNAAMALATVRALARTIPVSPEAERVGLASLCWPGRLQSVTRPGGGTWVLDGAHNLAGAQALRRTWAERFADVRPVLILGVLSDKDWAGIASTLTPLAERVLVVPIQNTRGLAPAILAPVCGQARPGIKVEVCASLAEALARVAEEPSVLLTGSLYLVGEAMERLGLSATPRADERGLNEWGRRSTAAGGAHATP